MQTIGERLEEARKRKGISIREAAETTKIRGDYLQKFEANTFEIDLPPLYLKGFVRAYARFLDLDAERIVSELASVVAEGKPGGRRERENREVYGRVDFGENPRAPEAGDATPVSSRGNSGGSSEQATMIKLGLIGGGVVIGILVIILLVKVLFGGSEPTRASATRESAPSSVQADAAQTLTLTAIDATRVKVVQDLTETVLFNGSLARGESKSLPKQGALRITVEDRTKVRIEVNGRNYDIPPLQGGNFGRFVID